jgi:hypothetical protein
MKIHKVNKKLFKFIYLPAYAAFLLENKLEEFVIVGIRFSREIDLPILKPLAKYSEAELVAVSLESNRQVLRALITGNIAAHIEENINKWIANKLGVLDKSEIVAEDLTLAFFIRRKIFSYFLDSYTKNLVEQKFIIAEVDVYTTQEELISYKAYLGMQAENTTISTSLSPGNKAG